MSVIDKIACILSFFRFLIRWNAPTRNLLFLFLKTFTNKIFVRGDNRDHCIIKVWVEIVEADFCPVNFDHSLNLPRVFHLAFCLSSSSPFSFIPSSQRTQTINAVIILLSFLQGRFLPPSMSLSLSLSTSLKHRCTHTQSPRERSQTTYLNLEFRSSCSPHPIVKFVHALLLIASYIPPLLSFLFLVYTLTACNFLFQIVYHMPRNALSLCVTL